MIMRGIEADYKANVLNIKVEGYISNEAATAVADKIKKSIFKLKEGFTIVNDIRELKPLSPEAFWVLREIIELIDAKQPSKVVRIEGSSISKLQFDRALRQSKANFKVDKIIESGGAFIDASF